MAVSLAEESGGCVTTDPMGVRFLRRKRHRQERLHEMRTGEVSHWVHLERQMPSNCPLPPPKRQGMPSSQRDRFGQERRPTEA